MSRRKKRLQRIRQNPKNVSLDDLCHALEDYGVMYLQTTGSHYTFRYVLQGQTELLVIPFRRPVKLAYVKQALKLIDQIIEEQGDDDDSDDD